MPASIRQSYLSPPRSFLARQKTSDGTVYEKPLAALLERYRPFLSPDHARGFCERLRGATLVPSPEGGGSPSTPRKDHTAS